MAERELSFLTGKAGEALPYLKGAAAEGLTPTAAIALLKGLNLTFNRQRMLDVYAALQARVDPERAARLVGQNVPLPQELHFTYPRQMSSDYEYVVEAVDEFAEPIGYVTISSSVPLAANEIRARGGLLFVTQSELYLEEEQQIPHSVSITEANVNASAVNP
jgi:hypothetical protein